MTPDERARAIVPERATTVMIDDHFGSRKIYLAEAWRAEIAGAIREAASRARDEEGEACAARIEAVGPKDYPSWPESHEHMDYAHQLTRRLAAALRARPQRTSLP